MKMNFLPRIRTPWSRSTAAAVITMKLSITGTFPIAVSYQREQQWFIILYFYTDLNEPFHRFSRRSSKFSK